MKRAQLFLLILAAGLLASYALAFIHPFGDAGLGSRSGSPQQWGNTAIPPGIHAVLAAKCGDCHSRQTRAPIYAHFVPASWLIERDVIRARGAMDLSYWDSESSDDRQIMIAKIAHIAKKREMPPVQYLAMHWNARLNTNDLRAIAGWAQANAPDGEDSESGAALQGDAGRGKVVFEKRCTGCHALENDREGPRLKGVFGRIAGTVSGYDYSPALKNSHIEWSETTLERWLNDPDSVAPNNNMDFHVANPGERKDIIQFLKEQSQPTAH